MLSEQWLHMRRKLFWSRGVGCPLCLKKSRLGLCQSHATSAHNWTLEGQADCFECGFGHDDEPLCKIFTQQCLVMKMGGFDWNWRTICCSHHTVLNESVHLAGSGTRSGWKEARSYFRGIAPLFIYNKCFGAHCQACFGWQFRHGTVQDLVFLESYLKSLALSCSLAIMSWASELVKRSSQAHFW